jgi:hypothetical protein
MEQLGSHWTDFHEICNFRHFSENHDSGKKQKKA